MIENVLNEIEDLIQYALSHGEGSVVGFVFAFVSVLALTVLGALWLILTTNRFWHRAFHIGRVNRAYSCGHCFDAYCQGHW